MEAVNYLMLGTAENDLSRLNPSHLVLAVGHHFST